MARYLIIRTAATEWEEEDRISGDFDEPVSVAGRAELDARLPEDQRYNFRQCWTGTDQPTTETAERVAAATGSRLRKHDGLREIHQGMWQGLLRSDVRRKHRRVFAEWQDDPERICPAAGEPLATVAARLRSALRDIGRKTRGDELVAIVVAPLVGALLECLVSGRPTADVLQVRDRAPALQVLAGVVAPPGPNGQNGPEQQAPPSSAVSSGQAGETTT